MTSSVSVRMSLLDAQVVDAERLPIGRVDDLELEVGEGEHRVTALLTGAQALGERLDGRLGNAIASAAARLRGPGGSPEATRIDIRLVDELEPMVRLSVRFADLRDVADLERWLARHLIAPLPGTGDAGE